MEPVAITRSSAKSYAFIAANIVACFALVILTLWILGYITGLDDKKEAIFPKFNTALLLFLSALGLLFTMLKKRRAAIGSAAIVIAMAFATLSQYMFSTSLGIDQIFMRDISSFQLNPGRMSPNATFAFGATGAVLLLLNTGSGVELLRLIAIELLSIIVFALGIAAFIGRLEHVEFAYSFGSTARMSIITACMFMLLGTAMLSFTWNRQNAEVARIPVWVPALLCFLVLLLDISIPYGITVGICYIPLVFCGLWFNRPHVTFVFAAAGSILSLFGYYLKPPSDVAEWIVLTNRFITFAALWLVAILVFMQKRAQANLTHYNEKLMRSNQELDDFAYIASHDLKEPLRGLYNHASFLHEDYADKLDAEGKRRLERLSKLCQRMERLVNDLLYFSRLGRGELAIQRTEPKSIIEEIKLMMEVTLKEKNASIIIQPMPAVVCDKPRMTEVFRNLITNAVKYNNNPLPIIEIGWNAEHGAFYVKDNGIGIDKEFHTEIFRIFKRLNPSEEGDTGTGVGLTFVKKIIERHKGRIWVESSLGNGATFYFTTGERT